MPKPSERNARILALMRILLEQTDENHPLTIAELAEQLGQVGISASRKTLYGDLAELQAFGIDVERCVSRTTSYFVANRMFELPELKLLADAVAAAKFITEKKSAQLIEKISGLASRFEATEIRRQVFVRGRVKTQNEQIYYNVDTIHQAIAARRPVSFLYFEYCIGRGTPARWTKHYRRDGRNYEAVPYALTWDHGNYYMVAYYEKYGGLSNFRVDRMEQISLLGAEAVTQPEPLSFDPAQYAKKLFGMFSGPEKRVTLRFDDSLAGVVRDRFGPDAAVTPLCGGKFLVTADVEISPKLLGWLFEYGNRVTIVEPQSLVEEFRRMAAESLSQYQAGAAPSGGENNPLER